MALLMVAAATMNWVLLSALLGGAAVLLLLERMGLAWTPHLGFKGDLNREARFLAQYGQGTCVVTVAILLWRMDHRKLAMGLDPFVPVLVATFGTALIAVAIKRLCGRVRPGREQAGQFLGPSLRHQSSRESFPSMHTASAAAMTVVLAHLYPQGAAVFWTLAVICGTLRFLMDAHWPSDVLAGFALGYGVGWIAWSCMGG
jgi:undecaprenyl-diphosphatase